MGVHKQFSGVRQSELSSANSFCLICTQIKQRNNRKVHKSADIILTTFTFGL